MYTSCSATGSRAGAVVTGAANKAVVHQGERLKLKRKPSSLFWALLLRTPVRKPWERAGCWRPNDLRPNQQAIATTGLSGVRRFQRPGGVGPRLGSRVVKSGVTGEGETTSIGSTGAIELG
jgi:hypothetical protein